MPKRKQNLMISLQNPFGINRSFLMYVHIIIRLIFEIHMTSYYQPLNRMMLQQFPVNQLFPDLIQELSVQLLLLPLGDAQFRDKPSNQNQVDLLQKSEDMLSGNQFHHLSYQIDQTSFFSPSVIIQQDLQQNSQQITGQPQQNKSGRRQKFNAYCCGHIDFLIQSVWCGFGLSRKYQRTKKKHFKLNPKGNSKKLIKRLSELQAMAKRMNMRNGKGLDTDYAKRYDQEENKKFRKIPVKQQDKNDITPSALNNIIENKGKGDNSALLEAVIKKCNQMLHFADYLKVLAREDYSRDLEDQLS